MEDNFPLLDALPVGVCLLSPDFETRFWNRVLEQWTGLSRTEMVGRSIFETCPALKQSKYKERFRLVLDDGLPAVFSSQIHKAVLPCKRRDGTLRDQQTTVTRTQLGEEVGLMVAVEDVSELTDIIRKNRAFQKRLEAQKDYLRIFAGAAAHDLQAPLRHIAGFADLLAMNLGDELDDEATMCVDTIRSSTFRLQQLITDLLNHARAGVTGSMKPVSLDAALETALANLNLSRQTRGLHIPGKLPMVVGNLAALTQLCQNLIANAWKYTDELKNIEIRTEQTEGDVLLMVRDNGFGIPAEQMERIFLPFQSYTRGKETGTGLGLTTCSRIAEIHDGEIWAESELGCGSTFWVRLPAANSAPVAKAV